MTLSRHGYYLSQIHYACLGVKKDLPRMHVKMDKLPTPRMKRTSRKGQVHLPGPGHPAPRPRTSGLPRTSGPLAKNPVPRTRQHRRVHRQPGHPAPRPRTSGLPRSPGHPAPARKSGASIQEPQRPNHPARTSGVLARTSGASGSPGHPARCPDIRRLLRVHSEGPKPLAPFDPVDYIYSIPFLF